jgi:hypothetical protein
MNNKKTKGRPKKDEKDKIKPNERIKCDLCDEVYNRCNKSRHLKSKIHNKIVLILIKNNQIGGNCNVDDNKILKNKSKLRDIIRDVDEKIQRRGIECQ